jgi:hypothetical protein
VSLIRKQLSNALVAANRANSPKSTGPQSELGKRNSSQNAGKHPVYAEVSSASLKELGENPADFYKLRDSLRTAIAPLDGFGEMLVANMAELRWRRMRLLRAEAGIMASKRRKFELQHEWEPASAGRGAGARFESETIDKVGGGQLAGWPRKYSEILEMLKLLRQLVQTRGFEADGLAAIDLIYGKMPDVYGLALQLTFKCFQKDQEAGDDVLRGVDQFMFEKLVDREVDSFEGLAQLTRERDERLTEPRKDAQLLPRQKDLEKIMRYEASLERLYERKLQQLVAWRKEKGEGGKMDAAQGGAGGRAGML